MHTAPYRHHTFHFCISSTPSHCPLSSRGSFRSPRLSSRPAPHQSPGGGRRTSTDRGALARARGAQDRADREGTGGRAAAVAGVGAAGGGLARAPAERWRLRRRHAAPKRRASTASRISHSRRGATTPRARTRAARAPAAFEFCRAPCPGGERRPYTRTCGPATEPLLSTASEHVTARVREARQVRMRARDRISVPPPPAAPFFTPAAGGGRKSRRTRAEPRATSGDANPGV